MTTPRYVAVCGSSVAGEDLATQAEAVGRGLAEGGAIVVCGGLGGVMDAAARGAREAGGVVIGILPGEDRVGSSEHLTAAIATGMGEARNALVVRAADVVIAVGGEWGTLSEIALAMRTGTPVIGLGTWEVSRSGAAVEGILRVTTPDEAVRAALAS